MGYNTWNDLGCKEMSEANVKAAAAALVKSGLRDLGYVYVNLDDCWQASKRNPNTGRLEADPTRFPSGMKALGDHLHSLNLRFGIYTDRGSRTCAGRPGSFKHEALDAQTFADWGVDYVKEDNCHSSKGPNDKESLFQQFGEFRDSLNKTGRPIFFSVCGGGDQGLYTNLSYYASDERGGKNLANSWRIHSDCIDWTTCLDGQQVAAGLQNYAGPGGFNDPDMLLGSQAKCARWLSTARSRTQFNLWAILMAPLLLGTRLTAMPSFDLQTYSNAAVIAVNQDPLGQQGYILHRDFLISVWGRPLHNGDWAVAFVNNNPIFAANVVCDEKCWTLMPFQQNQVLYAKDLWNPNATAIEVSAGKPWTQHVPGKGSSTMWRLSTTRWMDTLADSVDDARSQSAPILV